MNTVRYFTEEEKDILAINFAQFIIDQKCSIRDCADNLNYHRTTVHRYLTERLKKCDYDLYRQVQDGFIGHKLYPRRDFVTGKFEKFWR